MAIISSLMKTEMTTVKPGDSVADAARLMSQNQVGAVLVVEGGAMKGILSERDVVSRVVAEGRIRPQHWCRRLRPRTWSTWMSAPTCVSAQRCNSRWACGTCR